MDKFNDIWKNRFNDGELPLGDWSLPEDEVWEQILPHVPTKKRNRKWWWFFLCLALLSLGYFGFSFTSKLPSADFVSNKTEAGISELLAHHHVSNAKEQTNHKTQQIAGIELSEAKAQWPSHINTQLSKIKKASKTIILAPEVSNRIIVDDIIHKETSALLPETVPTVELSDQSAMESIGRTELNRVGVEALPLLKFRTENVEEPLQPDLQMKIWQGARSRLSLSADVGAVLWQHKISTSYQTDLAAFDFNYSDAVGWSTALGLQFSINEYVDLFGALQYEEVQTASGHNTNLAYQLTQEGAAMANNYILDLATPYGLSKASFRLERREALSDESTALVVDFQSMHTIRNASVPLGIAAYPLGKQRRWIPSARIGVGLNYLMGISNELNHIDTHHSAIQFTKEKDALFQAPEINQWFLDFRLGLGIQYHLKSNLQIGINADWSRGFNPIFEQGNYQTRINRYYLSIGLTKVL